MKISAFQPNKLGGGGGGGGQPDFSDFSDPDFGKINFHIGKIGKQFFANISLPDHFRAYVDS